MSLTPGKFAMNTDNGTLRSEKKISSLPTSSDLFINQHHSVESPINYKARKSDNSRFVIGFEQEFAPLNPFRLSEITP